MSTLRLVYINAFDKIAKIIAEEQQSKEGKIEVNLPKTGGYFPIYFTYVSGDSNVVELYRVEKLEDITNLEDVTNTIGEAVADGMFEVNMSTSWNFSDGLARVEKNGKIGYINKDGEFVIGNLENSQIEIENAKSFSSDGYATIYKDEKESKRLLFLLPKEAPHMC